MQIRSRAEPTLSFHIEVRLIELHLIIHFYVRCIVSEITSHCSSLTYDHRYLLIDGSNSFLQVDLACDQLVADDSCVKTPLKSLALKGSFGPSNIVQKFNTTNMKHLELVLGLGDEATSLPNLENFESLTLLSGTHMMIIPNKEISNSKRIHPQTKFYDLYLNYLLFPFY